MSKQFDGENNDEIELMTNGTFMHGTKKSVISYDETEATGFEGSKTTLYLNSEKLITLVRSGEVSSRLIIELGKKHHCHYETPYGVFNVGVTAKSIESTINENGGKLFFSYVIDVNSSYVGDFEISLDIDPIN